ncbi:MAG: CRISPR-associated endonuclease Cas2 [Lachnospiraceae bacterium]|nr:CRISPR-associated endonuclease Cas2 [Lachnospiraceae bacterium]
MRIIVMFDLPTVTMTDKREYTLFRKFLLKNGFFMLQQSIYCKLAQNAVAADSIVEKVKKNKPPAGSVMLLKVTEKQFSKMEYIVGEASGEILDTDERLVIL